MINIAHLFLQPTTPLQRRYEAIRAVALGEMEPSEAAKKYGYSISTFYSFIRDLRSGKLALFPEQFRGPLRRQTPEYIQNLVGEYRKKMLSAKDIKLRLEQAGYEISTRTIERILNDLGFIKLPRRTLIEQGRTVNNQLISDRATPLDFGNLQPFRYNCQVAGIFFFIPYIIESGIIDIMKQCKLPQSSAINSTQACLSMLLLKLIGSERLGHIQDFDHDPGLGIFAGLNLLPKATYLSTYSCRTSEDTLLDFQMKIMKRFQMLYPSLYRGNFINLDFHSIPHFGEQSHMEKVWCGARGKAMKGANTLFAQNSESNAIIYTRADILRKNESREINNFIKYWKSIKGSIKETLVFDCRLTTYNILDDLSKDNIKFITLQKRSKGLLDSVSKIKNKEWQKCYLPIPKRKHKNCLVFESEILLKNCKFPVRQIIVTGNGRAQPTFIITNNRDLSIKDILLVYAKRWHIENKFADLVAFFNLNALSSPLMIRIHFDILWTVIADTLYRRFAQDLPRFEQDRANTLFRHFINMPGQVIYDKKEFVIKIRKRAHTPILMGVDCLKESFRVPWLNDQPLKVEWTA